MWWLDVIVYIARHDDLHEYTHLKYLPLSVVPEVGIRNDRLELILCPFGAAPRTNTLVPI
jgi:hypothetical protein